MSENVKDIIEEIKNLSELMLDLSYSSVLFENCDIAKEVMLLFDRFEEHEENLYLHLFAASRGGPARAKRLISVIDLVESAKSVASAAKNMSEMVIEGKKLHPIIKEAIKESEETMAKAEISRSSPLAERPLGETLLRTKTGANIIALRRGKVWIFRPKRNTLIKAGDSIIGVGTIEACRKLEGIASGKIKEI